MVSGAHRIGCSICHICCCDFCRHSIHASAAGFCRLISSEIDTGLPKEGKGYRDLVYENAISQSTHVRNKPANASNNDQAWKQKSVADLQSHFGANITPKPGTKSL